MQIGVPCCIQHVNKIWEEYDDAAYIKRVKPSSEETGDLHSSDTFRYKEQIVLLPAQQRGAFFLPQGERNQVLAP